MGLLKCQLFQTPPEVRNRLEQCLLNDPDHVIPGSRGEHVQKIQSALNRLSKGAGRENFNLKEDGIYGPRTAGAVKAYKNAPSRKIMNPPQKTADDIVGKRTIKSLDDEMDILENELPSGSALVSETVLGAPHDHSKCPLSGFSRPGSNGRVHHMATPINPIGSGRKIILAARTRRNTLAFRTSQPEIRPRVELLLAARPGGLSPRVLSVGVQAISACATLRLPLKSEKRSVAWRARDAD